MNVLHRAPIGALGFALLVAVGARADEDLARRARASASEQQDDFSPQKACDGDLASRWSGIPGHVSGVWFELAWDADVTIAEVVIHQFDRYVIEADLERWDDTKEEWRTISHLGAPDRRWPSIVIARFEPVRTRRLRIAHITNGPSFTEVEVHSARFGAGIVTNVAADLTGNLIGMVSDPFGAEGIAGATIELAGTIDHGDRSSSSPGSERRSSWRRTATSDATGQFEVPLPLDLDGDLTITTRAGEAKHLLHIDASAFGATLTPRDDSLAKPFVAAWRFQCDPPPGFEAREFDDEAWPTIAVPSHWAMEGFEPSHDGGGVGGYRAHFTIDAESIARDEKRVILAFDGVYSGAVVYLNGKQVAAHEGATPFECDITRAVRDGDNVVALRVTEHTTTSDSLDQMSAYADFPLGGIFRPIWLVEVPALHLSRIALASEFDPTGENAKLHGRVVIENSSARSFLGMVQLTDSPRHDLLVVKSYGTVPFSIGPWERVEVPFDLPWRSWSPWSAEHPNLYDVVWRLDTGGEGPGIIEELHQRIGIRETRISGSEILVDGKPVKFRGACHHDSHPRMGRAVTKELERVDLEAMKAANLNALRTSHYPPLPELLDLADEIGLYVEDEASFCWVGVADDLRLAPRIRQLTSELIVRDRNHPSVFMWSLCNESQYGRDFELAHAAAARLDPSRPFGAATSATLDIATAHNPITKRRIEENERLDRPLLFDESFAPFQGIWGDAGEDFLDPGVRDAYVVPLRDVYAAMMASKVTQGSMIWAWSDDIFCVPNRGVEFGRGGNRIDSLANVYALPRRGRVGDAPWGLVDGWRRAKPELYHVKKMHSPIRIAESALPLPEDDESIRIPVANEFDFTDLNELTIDWRIGDEGGRAKLSHGRAGTLESIPPRTSGELFITPLVRPERGEELELEFRDAKGRNIDSYRLSFGERVVPAPNIERPTGTSLAIESENSLAGRFIRVRGDSFEIAFDRDSGRLVRAIAFGAPALLELPSLHLLESGKPFAPLPDRTTWRASAVSARMDGGNARISIDGSYDRFEGRYEFVVTPTGEISGEAHFVVRGTEAIVAREIGWRIATPRTFDRLEWSRLGEWSAYPDDHIGRGRGVAFASYGHVISGSPSWPFAEDESPFGSNDFRSTKRAIDWANLCGADGTGGIGVHVTGGGKQNARACREVDRVGWFVTDTFGGTGAGLFEWESNYTRGAELKPGATIDSKLRLELVRVRR